MPAIPIEVSDITASWLEHALHDRAPGAKLTAIEVIDMHSGTTGRARIKLSHDDARLPQSVFVKLAPFDVDQRKYVDQTGMGVTEARFYLEIARDVPVRHPHCYYVEHDESRRYVMVLEDLNAAGIRYPRQRDSDLSEFVDRTIDAFAALHAAFWESERFESTGDLGWVAGQSADYGSAGAMVKYAIKQLGDDLPEASRDFTEVYLPRAERIPALLAQGPRTLVHGDTHLSNMFVDDNTPGFLDWAVIGFGSGLRDIAYFLGGSIPTELRRAEERRLVERYCRRLTDHGITLDSEDAWNRYRLQLLNSWVAAVVTAGMGSKLQPLKIGIASTARADVAIRDHRVADLLRAHLP